MTTYYALLEVSPQASPEEIRRSYRRLVLLTHPDRTADPAAHRQYLAINEAYEVLSHPARRAAYDARLHALHRPPQTAPPLHRDPALRRQGRRAAPRPVATQANAYSEYLLYAQWVCRVCLAFVLLLVVDFCWVEHLPDEVVQSSDMVRVYARGRSVDVHEIVQTQHTSFRSYAGSWPAGTHLAIDQTRLFGIFRGVAPAAHPERMSNEDGVSIYDTFLFLPLLLAAMAGAGLGLRSSPYSINCAVACAILLPIVLYVLLAT